jgi:hypothetical protein
MMNILSARYYKHDFHFILAAADCISCCLLPIPIIVKYYRFIFIQLENLKRFVTCFLYLSGALLILSRHYLHNGCYTSTQYLDRKAPCRKGEGW